MIDENIFVTVGLLYDRGFFKQRAIGGWMLDWRELDSVTQRNLIREYEEWLRDTTLPE